MALYQVICRFAITVQVIKRHVPSNSSWVSTSKLCLGLIVWACGALSSLWRSWQQRTPLASSDTPGTTCCTGKWWRCSTRYLATRSIYCIVFFQCCACIGIGFNADPDPWSHTNVDPRGSGFEVTKSRIFPDLDQKHCFLFQCCGSALVSLRIRIQGVKPMLIHADSDQTLNFLHVKYTWNR
jgi:hypothetical protein